MSSYYAGLTSKLKWVTGGGNGSPSPAPSPSTSDTIAAEGSSVTEGNPAEETEVVRALPLSHHCYDMRTY